MKLDQTVVDSLTRDMSLSRHVRVTPMARAATPLGMGYGKTRFASPTDAFKVLYIAPHLVTAVAETLIRDRFAHKVRRRILQDEVELWGVTEVATTAPLRLIDMTGTGAIRLGVPSDALQARNQRAGRRLSADLYAQCSDLDGILYTSRHTRKPCIAVYDRGVPKLSAGPVQDLIDQPALLPALVDLNVSLILKP